MPTVRVATEALIRAPADRVYAILSDYGDRHPAILPPEFSDYAVEEGGSGAGTVIRFRLTLGGRPREARMRVDEPEPGRVLRETDLASGAATTFTVTPEGDGSRVRIETVWTTPGLRGWIERLVAPRVLRRLYLEELRRLDLSAREAGDLT
jgi:hypothetical protein